MTERTDTGNKKDGETVEDESDTPPTLSWAVDSESDDQSEYVGDRFRNRLNLSLEQWELLVSVMTFLPYPVFAALILTDTVDSLAFLLLTLAYSVFAMYANLVL